MSKLRNFDAYPKINEDFYSRTLSGGVITLASSIVMFLLFFSELRMLTTLLLLRYVSPLLFCVFSLLFGFEYSKQLCNHLGFYRILFYFFQFCSSSVFWVSDFCFLFFFGRIVSSCGNRNETSSGYFKRRNSTYQCNVPFNVMFFFVCISVGLFRWMNCSSD